MDDLSRRLSNAKIPCPETGVEIRKSVCNVCCSAFYCGQNVYMKDGKVIKVEGDPDHPTSRGRLCTKGLSTREYVFSPRRIRSPMKRVGGRGKGEFVPISWDEAFELIREKLSSARACHGPESVAFYSGIEKWYQSFLQRLAYSFGSPNFCNASGTCFEAVNIAWALNAGRLGRADVANSGCYLAFSLNQYYSREPDAVNMEALRRKGLKCIVVDPRRTPAVDRLADLHLQNLPGTDGAVAHGLANLIIRKGLIDQEYIDAHVHGFPQYAAYISTFTPDVVESISGVPAARLEQAVDLIAANMPMSIHESVSPIVHHVNGVQNYRAVMALSAITGCYDRKGGNLPRYNTFSHMGAGFETKEHEFIHETEPKHHPPAVGAWRFPVFEKVAGYGQSMDLFRQIMQGTPYPIKVLVAFGLNFRMFPEDNRFSDVLEKLDFYVDVDLFWTDSARYADLVLPACSILERDEFKVVKGGKGYYVQALLDPLYDSRSDYDIIKGIADVLDLDDELLRSGYDQCIDHMLSNHGITAKELKQAARPVTMPGFRPYVPGTYTLQGYDTPTGKFELWSTVLEQYGYDPLPTYRSSLDDADPEDYPMILFTGSSIPNAYNSRLEHVESLRRLRPEPQADIGIGDARRMGISYGDMIKVSTPLASIELKANPSQMIKDGTISIYHGYRKADVNILIGADHLDPISGFCGFKSVRCRVERVMEEST